MTDADKPERAAPGWYPANDMAHTIRYWDGEKWTDNVQAAPPAAMPPADSGSGLVGVGVVTALLIPIVGFVIGCILASKSNDSGTGALVIVLSLVGGAGWFYLLSSQSGY